MLSNINSRKSLPIAPILKKVKIYFALSQVMYIVVTDKDNNNLM